VLLDLSLRPFIVENMGEDSHSHRIDALVERRRLLHLPHVDDTQFSSTEMYALVEEAFFIAYSGDLHSSRDILDLKKTPKKNIIAP
jgi:hypothetical protein